MLKQVVLLFFLLQFSIFELCKASDKNSLSKKSSVFKKKKKEESAALPLLLSLGYSVSSDFASELKPRKYSHLISADLLYKLDKSHSLIFASSFYYISLDKKIVLEEASYGFNDLSVSLKRKMPLINFLFIEHSPDIILTVSLPLSEEARFEGYKAIPSIEYMIRSSFFNAKYEISNNFSYSYVINTYEYSPMFKTANNKNNFSYSMNHFIQVLKNLKFKLGFSFRYSKDTQGESNYNYNNYQSIAYKISKFYLELTHVNGGFVDDGDISFWYIDKYRKIVKASFSYSF